MKPLKDATITQPVPVKHLKPAKSHLRISSKMLRQKRFVKNMGVM